MPIGTLESFIPVKEGLYPVLTWRQGGNALDWIAKRTRINDGLLTWLKTFHVEAKNLLGVGIFSYLQAWLAGIIPGNKQQHAPIEGVRAAGGGERNSKL
jgi:hypothetical protein